MRRSRTFGRGNSLLRFLSAAFVLLPLSLLMTAALFLYLAHVNYSSEGFFKSLMHPSIWYTFLGVATIAVMFLMRLMQRFLGYMYTLGHELSHALAIVISGGHIYGFKATSDRGGYVKTEKSNLFIDLIPYFLPLWMLLWMLLIALVQYFFPFSFYTQLFYYGVGFWWSLHLYKTFQGLLIQSDLSKNGLFFSALLVYLVNLLILIFGLWWVGLLSASAYLTVLKYCFTKSFHLVHLLIQTLL